ncbi:WD40-repeat-containing domain protein [Phlyctochytrium arcticum]|nr:WD40-repeat-containing domain protein [Phlyctochytrium arcticum]
MSLPPLRQSLLKSIEDRERDFQTPFISRVTSSKSLCSRLKLERRLTGHTGCVNTLQWNHTGTTILSGSDDCQLKVWDPFNGKLCASIASGHQSNIFSAKFVPYFDHGSDLRTVSCDALGMVRYTDFNQKTINPGFNCHADVTYEVAVDSHSPHLFWSSSDDGTVNQYDLRESTSCECDPSSCTKHSFIDLNLAKGGKSAHATHVMAFNAVSQSSIPPLLLRQLHALLSGEFPSAEIGCGAIDINPIRSEYMAVAGSDNVVRIYDRRLIRNADVKSSGEVYSCLPARLKDVESQARTENSGDSSDSDSSENESTLNSLTRHRITSVKFDPFNSGDLLVSYSFGHLYLLQPNLSKAIPYLARENSEENDLADELSHRAPEVVECHDDSDIARTFVGHKNAHTMIKEANFFGGQSEFIMSGSDDGKIFVWDKESSEICCLLKGDRDVVNCVQPHPYLPIVASSGIDSDIKMWWPDAADGWKKGALLDMGSLPQPTGRTYSNFDLRALFHDP